VSQRWGGPLSTPILFYRAAPIVASSVALLGRLERGYSELPLYGVLRSSPLARLSGIMLATVRDELRSRVGQQGGWRHDEDGVNNGLDSAGRGVLRHPPDPVRKPQTQVSSAIHSEFIAMCSHFAE
jgi:hypothetical protein